MTYVRERYSASLRPAYSPAELRAELQRIQRSIPHPAFTADIRDFGARGNGTTDDTVAIQAAINAASAAGGGVVHVPLGDWLCGDLDGAANVAIVGEGRGSVLVQGGTNAQLITFGGSLGTWYSLTANAAAGDTTLALSSSDASNFAAGDYALLGSDELVPNSTSTTSEYGEIVRVKSVAGGTVTLEGAIADAYTTANTAQLAKLSLLAGGAMRNLSIENPNPGTLTNGFALFRYCLDPRLENIWAEGADGSVAMFQHCYGGSYHNGYGKNLTDDTANDRYGYHVLAAGATTGLRISNVHTDKARHAFTTGGVPSQPRGVPRGVVLTNCTASHCSQPAFDTHQEGEGITFENCTAVGNPARGFRSRAPRTRFVGCVSIRNRVDGFHIGEDATDNELHGVVAEGTTTTGGDGNGIRVEGSRCTIVGGVASNNARHGLVLGDGSGGVTVTDTVVTGFAARNNRTAGAGDGAIYIDSATSRTTLVGVEASGERYGVNFVSGCATVTLLGGQFFSLSLATYTGTLPSTFRAIGVIGFSNSIGRPTGKTAALELTDADIQLVLAENLTDSTAKIARVGAMHYTNSEEPVGAIAVNAAAATNAVLIGGGSALFNAATLIDFYTAANTTTTTGTLAARVDNNTTAGNTRFMVYDVDNATLERVSVGAADSGGVGYKLLRIPN